MDDQDGRSPFITPTRTASPTRIASDPAHISERARSSWLSRNELPELEHGGSEPVLPALRRPARSSSCCSKRAQQAVDGGLRDPQSLRDLRHAETRRVPQRHEDARGAVDGLDRAAPISRGGERGHHGRRMASSSAPKMSAVEVAPGSWWPMLREPRYDARPFRACIGSVAATPAFAASAALRAACSVTSHRTARSARTRRPRAPTRRPSSCPRAPPRRAPGCPRARHGALDRSASPSGRLGLRERRADLAEARCRRAGPRRHPRDRRAWSPPLAGALPGAVPDADWRVATRRRTHAPCSPRGRRRRSPRRAGSGSPAARRSARPIPRSSDARTRHRRRTSPTGRGADTAPACRRTAHSGAPSVDPAVACQTDLHAAVSPDRDCSTMPNITRRCRSGYGRISL